MRVTVIGAGIMGLATAWALTKRGHAVTVFEQGPIPNPLGSSVDQHRVIRQPYGAMDKYALMLDAAYAAWEALWEDLGAVLYAETGFLAIDSGEGSWARISADSMKAANLSFDWLSADEMTRRWPVLSPVGVEGAMWTPRGGALYAGAIVEQLAHWLGTSGARLRPHTAVTDIDPERATVTLGSGAREAADALVVAVGPWLPDLLPGMASRATPSRQLLTYARPPDDLAGAWHATPCLVDITGDDGFYLVPPIERDGHSYGLKIGDHNFTREGRPDERRDALRDETEALLARCRTRFRDFDRYRVDHGKTCYYTVSDRERFIVEPLAASTWVMSGFSGHGFKFGALMGQAVADALDGSRCAAEVTAWAAAAS